MSNHEPADPKPSRDSSGAAAEGPETADVADDTRRKFREALDRKRHRQHATAEAAPRDGSAKAHGTAAPTKGPQFRRKAI